MFNCCSFSLNELIDLQNKKRRKTSYFYAMKDPIKICYQRFVANVLKQHLYIQIQNCEIYKWSRRFEYFPNKQHSISIKQLSYP